MERGKHNKRVGFELLVGVAIREKDKGCKSPDLSGASEVFWNSPLFVLKNVSYIMQLGFCSPLGIGLFIFQSLYIVLFVEVVCLSFVLKKCYAIS